MNELLSANLAFRKNIAPGLIKCGFKAGNQRVLIYIADHPGCLQKDIAENCFIETSTLSTVLSNLEKKGLLERKRLANDNRAYAIYVTPKAQPMIDASNELFDSMIDIALGGFTQKEADELRAYLNRMTNNLINNLKKTGNVSDS